MGSIAILIGMKLAYTILFILASIFDSCNICCSYSHSCCHIIRNTWNNQTNPRHFVNSWIGFILGIFIELLICSAISVSFISQVQRGERSAADKLSVITTICSLIIVTLFPLFVLWFSCFKSKELFKNAKEARKQKYS